MKRRSYNKYAKDVTAGRVTACKWVILACERYLVDIERKDIFFDYPAADRAINFFKTLRHIKGEWAKSSDPIKLEPWQEFLTANMFGFKTKKGGPRRFKTAYIEVARKNSKTTMAAGWAGYLFSYDGEPGAEVYSLGTMRDQAKISFDTFKAMVKKSPDLSNKIGVFRYNLHIEDTFSKFEPLSADYNTLDGLNIHGAICDEVHEWRGRGLWDVIETATGSRLQPLQIAITTSGTDQASICYEQRQYVTQILNNAIQDDSYFGIIYTIDTKNDWPGLKTKIEYERDGGVQEDDWQDEKNWTKANPNLGVSVYLDDLRRKAKKAERIPAAQNNFLRKHMDCWTQQVTRWLSLEMWDANNAGIIPEKELKGRWCVAGIDLSAVSDMTCCVYLFPHDDDRKRVDLIMRCWCPEVQLHNKKNKYRDQYQAWEKEGWLIVTPGNVVDYDFVLGEIMKDHETFEIGLFGVDYAFQGVDFCTRLMEKMGHSEKTPKVIATGNSPTKLGPVCNELERRLIDGKINHGGNPVLRFMADSVSVRESIDGYKKPDKDKSQGKIDGIVAMLYALDRLIKSKPPVKSAYEDRGVLVF